MHEIFDLDGTSIARLRIREDDTPELLILTPAIEDAEGNVTPAESISLRGWDMLTAIHEGLIRLHEARLLSGGGE